MPVVVVANPKGGVGKSTLSTQIAGYFASQSYRVMLGDADRQQSSRLWLSLRPPIPGHYHPGYPIPSHKKYVAVRKSVQIREQ